MDFSNPIEIPKQGDAKPKEHYTFPFQELKFILTFEMG